MYMRLACLVKFLQLCSFLTFRHLYGEQRWIRVHFHSQTRIWKLACIIRTGGTMHQNHRDKSV